MIAYDFWLGVVWAWSWPWALMNLIFFRQNIEQGIWDWGFAIGDCGLGTGDWGLRISKWGMWIEAGLGIRG